MLLSAFKLIDRGGVKEPRIQLFSPLPAGSSEDERGARVVAWLSNLLQVDTHTAQQVHLSTSAEGSVMISHSSLADASELSALAAQNPQLFTIDSQGTTVTLWYSLPSPPAQQQQQQPMSPPAGAVLKQQQSKSKKRAREQEEEAPAPEQQQCPKKKAKPSPKKPSPKKKRKRPAPRALPVAVSDKMHKVVVVYMPRDNVAFQEVNRSTMPWRDMVVQFTYIWCQENGYKDIKREDLSGPLVG